MQVSDTSSSSAAAAAQQANNASNTPKEAAEVQKTADASVAAKPGTETQPAENTGKGWFTNLFC